MAVFTMMILRTAPRNAGSPISNDDVLGIFTRSSFSSLRLRNHDEASVPLAIDRPDSKDHIVL